MSSRGNHATDFQRPQIVKSSLANDVINCVNDNQEVIILLLDFLSSLRVCFTMFLAIWTEVSQKCGTWSCAGVRTKHTMQKLLQTNVEYFIGLGQEFQENRGKWPREDVAQDCINERKSSWLRLKATVMFLWSNCFHYGENYSPIPETFPYCYLPVWFKVPAFCSFVWNPLLRLRVVWIRITIAVKCYVPYLYFPYTKQCCVYIV